MDDAATWWDERYGEKERIWSGRVNATLVAEGGHLSPGTALDLGCGEGGDALWLAERGWAVTAVDVSAVALERARAESAARGLADAIDWRLTDLVVDGFPEGSWDLVSAQFLQSPLDFPRIDVLRAATGVVAPGGVLLAVSHAAGPPWAPPDMANHRFPQPDEELAALGLGAGWVVERCAVVGRSGTGPDGQEGELLDGVLRLRRSDGPR